MKNPAPLHYKLLRKKLDIAELDFTTTKEIKNLTEFVGHERAVAALILGVDIESQGYNLYAMGPPGIGKRSLIKLFLTESARKHAVPSDWCYVYNFEAPEKPLALKLPAGVGSAFQKDMKIFMDEIGFTVVTVFEGDEYHSGMKKISDFYEAKRKSLLKKNSQKKIDITPKLYKEQHEKEKIFESDAITSVVSPLINKLKDKYLKFGEIITYLIAVQDDIVKNIADLVKRDEKTNLFNFTTDDIALIKYKVNLLIDNSQLKGAPIIFEEHPSYSTLICRVEHISQAGILGTNFMLIKAGSLHQANGGYLVLEARKLRKNHEAWEALKSALYIKQIKIKPIENEIDTVKPVSLEPQPIPLNIKIILLGDRHTYYLLCQNDPDFLELFKIAVDFDEDISRNAKNILLYSRLIGSIARRKELLYLHANAVAEIIDHSSRLAEDAEKLSTHIREIEDILVEANYWAKNAHKKVIDAADIKYAINAKINRISRSKDIYYEDIKRDFIIINTEGELIGEVNCLSVRKVGSFSYGHPTRVTARVSAGKGKIIDIQREIKMAGPFHSKAVLIICHYLASQFGGNKPFSLFASIAFEQVYCWTEGDSASVGELCALLSALAEVPVYQSLAVTGSIDQYGEVQAVGGINEKIEGFFDVCKLKGMTGTEGVLIPRVNVKNLMLREDVIATVKAKKFFIYPIDNIHQAINLLTGKKCGERDKMGKFPKNTIYEKVENRLKMFIKHKK